MRITPLERQTSKKFISDVRLCIFCQKESKYIKGKPCRELRADAMIHVPSALHHCHGHMSSREHQKYHHQNVRITGLTCECALRCRNMTAI